MKTYAWQIKGLTPYLQESPKGMFPTDSGPKAGSKTPKPAEEAEGRTYRMASGQLYAPAVAFRSAMLDAALGFKIKVTSLKKILGGAVFTTDVEECPLSHPETGAPLFDYVVDLRRAVIPSSGAGIVRARPRVDLWTCRLELMIDPQMAQVDAEIVTEMLDRAGRICGIGGYRPASKTGKGGRFGRFTVEYLGSV